MRVHAYRGRFAPSPTGPLHLGSLFAALVSWVHARQHRGHWSIRIDDLDAQRCDPQWSDAIIATLAAFGLTSDTPIVYQSDRIIAYGEAFAQLSAHAYHCTCSRKSRAPGPYAGTCRRRLGKSLPLQGAIRVDCASLQCTLDDIIMGHCMYPHPGDPIIRRTDGLYAYQLACTVDDATDQITHVIRGVDLLESTLWQRHLMHHLHLTPPTYGHFPVLVGHQGDKLSKQHGAPGINPRQPGQVFRQLATILERPEPPDAGVPIPDWLDWWLAQGDVTSWWPKMRQNIPIA